MEREWTGQEDAAWIQLMEGHNHLIDGVEGEIGDKGGDLVDEFEAMGGTWSSLGLVRFFLATFTWG